MASLIMHLGMTKLLQTKYKLDDKVLLGSILPDLLKILNINSKEENHYLEKNAQLPNVDLYIKENNNIFDYVKLGYLFHLIQDRIWYQYLNILNQKMNISDEELRIKVYSDMNLLDRYILNRLKIDEKEFLSIKLKLEELSSDNDEIKKCIHQKLKIREIEEKNIYFITEEIIEEYIEKAILECDRYMKIVKIM